MLEALCILVLVYLGALRFFLVYNTLTYQKKKASIMITNRKGDKESPCLTNRTIREFGCVAAHKNGKAHRRNAMCHPRASFLPKTAPPQQV
jgi:hypothetical protein